MVGLVVEADEGVRRLIVALLEREGLRVHSAGDADAAMACIARQPPDYLILDQASCTEPQWRALSAHGDVPALLLRSDSAAGWSPMAPGHAIDKPFSPPFFVMAVKLWLLGLGLLVPAQSPMPPQAGTMALDIAAGSGHSTCLASDSHGPGTVVVGLDLTFAMVEQARWATRRLGYGNLLWVVGDARHLPFRHAVFDIVSGVEYVRDETGLAHRECERTLRGASSGKGRRG